MANPINPTKFGKIKLEDNENLETAEWVVVQDATDKKLGWVLKSSIGMNIPHLEFNNSNRTVWNNGKGNLPSNTSFGDGALNSNTLGNSNTANGTNSLFSNTEGISNTANGSNALQANTTGSSNLANGANALLSSTTGSNNTANGSGSGQFIADNTTLNTITNNSVYLGANTKAQADNQTNQTVIGYDAIGKGSNTIQLGNTSVTDLYTSAKITAAPATLSTHLVTKGQLDAKATNISIGNKTANTFDIVSSNGTGATAPSATITEAGLMTASDKVKINNSALDSEVIHKTGDEAKNGFFKLSGFNNVLTGKGLEMYFDNVSNVAGINSLNRDVSNVQTDIYPLFIKSSVLQLQQGNFGIDNLTNSPLARIHVGNLNYNASSDSQILIAREVNNDIGGNGHGFSDSSQWSRNFTGNAYNSYDARITVIGSGNRDHYAAFQSILSYSSTGDLADHYGYFSGGSIGSGTINNWFGAYMANPTSVLNGLNNSYGLYVKEQTSGKLKNYGVFAEGVSSFGTLKINDKATLSSDGSGVIDINYNNGINGGIYYYGGGTSAKTIIDSNGSITATPATLSTQVPTWGQTTVSPALTGTPTAPTATLGTNTTQIATTAFVLANSFNIPHLEFNNTDKTVWNNGKGNISTNTSFGINSLYSNTTGAGNTANGANALQANTTGGVNTANGIYTLFSNTTGGGNTANGSSALYSNTTGSFNNASGANAGRFIADNTTPNTITNNSIYLGANTKALADNQTNQTVIGYDTTGKGSNTVTIGNSSVTNNYFNGTLNVSNLAVYADNTTALAGGLSVGTMYRTSLGIVMIVY